MQPQEGLGGRGGDMQGRPEAERAPVSYVGAAGVAAWLGVKPCTVTKWFERYLDPPPPAPDAYRSSGPRGGSLGGRLWLPEREREWRVWAAARPGHWNGPGLVEGRALAVASMIAAEPGITGPEIAERLQIGIRTIRADVRRLREAGYPILANHGYGGGHRLGAGARVPPTDRTAIARAVPPAGQAAGAGGGAARRPLGALASRAARRASRR